MNEGERRLVRRVLMVALAVSALGARVTFATAPVPITGPFGLIYASVLLALLVALWRRWATPEQVAVGAAVAASVASFVTVRAAAAAVPAGQITPEAIANVTIPALVAITGVTFVGLAVRPAVLMSLAVLASQIAGIGLGAGAAAGSLLATRPLVMALRISILAIVLFAVVAAIAERRGTERDHEVRRRRLATRAAETERNAEAARSLVIAETGHELKTPLAVLRSALETLRDVGDRLTDEQRASAHATVWRTLERLEARTEAVLAASIERSSGPDTSPTTEFSALLADLLQDAGALLRPGALQLDLAAVGSVQVARVDLEHVIENLVVNAGKYGPQDGVVTVRSRVAGGGAVVIEVHDQGLTLTARDAAHIYEPGFRTTRATGVADGDGLGLALVERLVRGWGGEVRCDVNADGTTFAVTIPQA